MTSLYGKVLKANHAFVTAPDGKVLKSITLP